MGAVWGCAAMAEYTKLDIEVTTHTLIGNVVFYGENSFPIVTHNLESSEDLYNLF